MRTNHGKLVNRLLNIVVIITMPIHTLSNFFHKPDQRLEYFELYSIFFAHFFLSSRLFNPNSLLAPGTCQTILLRFNQPCSHLSVLSPSQQSFSLLLFIQPAHSLLLASRLDMSSSIACPHPRSMKMIKASSKPFGRRAGTKAAVVASFSIPMDST